MAVSGRHVFPQVSKHQNTNDTTKCNQIHISRHQNTYQTICSGAIINKWQFLTAAHCVFKKDMNKWRIVSGTSKVKNTPDYREVLHVKIHRKYDHEEYHDDIAIVTVKIPFDFYHHDENVEAVRLENETHVPNAGDKCLIAGWGAIDNFMTYPERLMTAQVPIWSYRRCYKTFESFANGKFKGRMFSGNICAGAPGKDSCQGDSGGPLVCHQNGQRVLVGLVSWGWICGHDLLPGVYTHILHYKDWIIENLATDNGNVSKSGSDVSFLKKYFVFRFSFVPFIQVRFRMTTPRNGNWKILPLPLFVMFNVALSL